MSSDKKSSQRFDYLKKPRDWGWMSKTARQNWLSRASRQIYIESMLDAEEVRWVYDEIDKLAKERADEDN
jgi:hypothetical protein